MTSAEKSQSAATRKGGATREKILQAARRRLIEDGAENFTLRDVAAEAGLTLGNLQYHFPTRDTLIQAVIAEQARLDREAVETASVDLDDPEKALRLLVEDLTERWRSEGAPLYLALASLALRDPGYRALFHSIYQEHYRSLGEAIAALRPGLPASEYALRAKILTAMLDGAPFQVVSTADKGEFLERLAEQAIAIALAP